MPECCTLLPQRPCISVLDFERVRVDLTADLDAAEQITTVVATEGTTTLGITDPTPNLAPYVDANTGDTVDIGKAATFLVENVPNTPGVYTIAVTATTNIDGRKKNSELELEMR